MNKKQKLSNKVLYLVILNVSLFLLADAVIKYALAGYSIHG